MISDSAKQKIAELSENNPTKEICGFIVKFQDIETVLEARNCAKENDKFFVIDPEFFYEYRNSLNFVFHSHIDSDEAPSDFDRQMCWNTLVPFIIYSVVTKRFFILEPKDCYYG